MTPKIQSQVSKVGGSRMIIADCANFVVVSELGRKEKEQ